MISLGLLGLIFALALGGLALEGNWRKFLRVLLAFGTYAAVLLGLLRVRGGGAPEWLPFWPFALAGNAAELVSRWLLPFPGARAVLSTAPAAALLIGGVHWLALRTWRPLRGWITAGRDADHPS